MCNTSPYFSLSILAIDRALDYSNSASPLVALPYTHKRARSHTNKEARTGSKIGVDRLGRKAFELVLETVVYQGKVPRFPILVDSPPTPLTQRVEIRKLMKYHTDFVAGLSLRDGLLQFLRLYRTL